MTVTPDLSAEGMLVAAPPGASPAPVRIGHLGGDDALVLSGPGATAGTEDLVGHRSRWGAAPPHDGAHVRSLLRDSRLDGRGGGGFPLGRKVGTALLAPRAARPDRERVRE